MNQQKAAKAADGLNDRALIGLFVLAVLALGVAASGAYQSNLRLLAAADSTAQAGARIERLSAVLDAVIDAETGSRGYVITGDPAFLAPYGRGNGVVARELDDLEGLYQGNAARGTLLSKLRAQVGERHAYVDSTVILRRDSGFATSRALVATGRGRVLTDSIRAIIGAIVQDEQEALRLGQLEVTAATTLATRTMAGGGVLAVALLAAAFIALRRESRRRQAAAREVATLNESLAYEVEQIREDLRVSEQRLRNALDGLLEGCAILDFECRYLYVNGASAAHGRSSVDKMIGRTMMDVYPGFEATELHATLQRTLVERVTQQVELEFEFPDGSTGWFQLHFDPVAEGAFVLSVEITERIRAQRLLEGSESRHRALLSGLPDLVFLLDEAGIVLDLHAPDHAQLVAPPAELVGRPVTASLPSAQAAELDAALRSVVEAKRPVTLSYELALRGGKRYFEATIVPTDGQRLTMVVRDLTARQSLEQQLRQAQKMEAVGQLTGGIAHDFNNVLTIIGSNAELLAAGIPPGSDAARDLDEILRATQRGADMIGRLLKFSRQGALDRRSVDPALVVADGARMLARLLPASIQFKVGAMEMGNTVLMDPGAFEQVLANLCTNARDAMPDGGIVQIDCASTWLDVGYQATHPWVKPGKFVCIAISDSGMGMDEATKARIFEPFFTTKPIGVGTGLGLAMVYGIMKDHEGMVHVYSEPGHGTVIKLYFPVIWAPAMDVASVPSRDVGLMPGGRETLLLAEDDAAIRLATRRALEGKGYRVLEAADGAQALAVYRQHHAAIALIISDLIMPNLNGHQLADALRADSVNVPIIFTSGFSRESVYRDPGQQDGVSFLNKPWTLSELLTLVRRVLDGEGEDQDQLGRADQGRNLELSTIRG